MRIEMKDGMAYVYTPFNRDFVTAMRAMSGHWDKTAGAWVVDGAFVDAVRERMRQIYGADDRPTKTVTVKVTAIEEITKLQGGVVVLGRPIAHAYGRDSGAKTDAGVAFLQGAPISDGSVKNWHTTIPQGSVFLIKDVPEEAVKSGLGVDPAIMRVEIVDVAAPDRTKLENEKARLLKRLAEIDKLLGGGKNE